ncbi:MAG: hypothetical protein ACTSPY_11080 [Candidatus Helarchaeota archaeon]
MIAKIDVDKWDGKSRLENLTPELRQILNTGTKCINTIMDARQQYSFTLIEYLEDYPKSTEKQKQIYEKVKKESGDVVTKYLEAVKAGLSPEVCDGINNNHRGYNIDKNHTISSLNVLYSGLPTSHDSHAQSIISDKLSKEEMKRKRLVPAHGSYSWRKLLIEKGEYDQDLTNLLYKCLEYWDVIPIMFFLWSQTNRSSLGRNAFSIILPLIGLSSDIKLEVISWYDLDFHGAKEVWNSTVRKEITSDNYFYFFDPLLGILQVTKNAITFEFLYNEYSPGLLINVSNIQIGKVYPSSIVLAYESDVNAKVMGKKSWEFPNLPLYSDISVIKVAKKVFKDWPIKGGKVSIDFYKKGFQIVKG